MKKFDEIATACSTQSTNTPQFYESERGGARGKENFTFRELQADAVCDVGVLYNRCGTQTSGGGALVRMGTDKYGNVRRHAPQKTACFTQSTNTPLFFESERGFGGKRKPFFSREKKVFAVPQALPLYSHRTAGGDCDYCDIGGGNDTGYVQYKENMSFRHNKNVNVVFFDGHVDDLSDPEFFGHEKWYGRLRNGFDFGCGCCCVN